MTVQEKLKYLNATQMPDGPYDIQTSPFVDYPVLQADAMFVKSQYEVAKAQLEKELAKGKETGAGASAAKAATAAAAAAGAPTDDGKKKSESVKKGEQSISALASQLAKPATAAAAAAAISAKSNVPSDVIFTGERGRLDALSSIRYKTYGLTGMDADKVKALRNLEVYVSRNTTFDTNGAKYAQDAATILESVKANFGIAGPNSVEGLKWLKWFRARLS